MKEYNINIASRLTGLTPHTLRAWEKRYSIIKPKRNPGGQRIYNEAEIEYLHLLNNLCSLGHNISTLKNKTQKELIELLEESGVTKDLNSNLKNLKNNKVLASESLEHLLLALKEYRLDVISHEFYNMKIKLSPKDLALNVISPLMGILERKILEGSLSVAQEHALSSIIKFHLGEFMFKGKDLKNKNEKLFVLSTPEGDFHEFGIILAGLLLLHYGQQFFYLGPNMPHQALLQASKSLNADSIILGTTDINGMRHPHSLDEYLHNILREIGKDTKLLVGGGGFFDLGKFSKKTNFSYLPTLNHFDNYLKETT